MAVNRVILIGNLGKEPDLKLTEGKTPIVRLSVATGEKRKAKDGNYVDHTEWHNVVAFGNTAENCAKFLAKGRQVYVDGRIQTRKWQAEDGQDRYSTEIVAQSVQFLGNKAANGAGDTNNTSSTNNENVFGDDDVSWG